MTRRPIKDQKLYDLEGAFRPLLNSCLEQCKNGRWGLFGQNESAEAGRYLQWDEGQYLREIARQIHVLREEFGQPNPLVELFLDYCSLRGSNVPGEPKLAQSLLDRIHSGEFKRS